MNALVDMLFLHGVYDPTETRFRHPCWNGMSHHRAIASLGSYPSV